MALEEAVSKGRCVVRRSSRDGATFSLSQIYLSPREHHRCQPLPTAKNVAGHTLSAQAGVFPTKQSDAEPLCVSRETQALRATHSLWLITLWL